MCIFCMVDVDQLLAYLDCRVWIRTWVLSPFSSDFIQMHKGKLKSKILKRKKNVKLGCSVYQRLKTNLIYKNKIFLKKCICLLVCNHALDKHVNLLKD